MLLFDKTRHETLSTSRWCDDIVLNEISFISADIEQSLTAEACWPTHPLDAESYSRAGPLWCAYAGAAGTVHAMQLLRAYGYLVQDLSDLLPIIYQSYLKLPDVSLQSGLQLGEIGILLPALLADPLNKALETRLVLCMEATLPLPLYEITSGQSGMMHAALALYRSTGKPIWKELYIKGANALLENWLFDIESKQWHWDSQIFGVKRRYYGACHGVAGNANILLQGIDLLDTDYSELIVSRTVDTLQVSAVQYANNANWLHFANPPVNKMLVQWCHGAAGIVTAMARTPISSSDYSLQLDDLLRKAGELVWQAGPLQKGSNICHGTSGNGYAFLYLYRRWGDSIWLERARAFAMHAIKQSHSARLLYGQGRYGLWTGDAGLALYLHHCLLPQDAAIPGLDLF